MLPHVKPFRLGRRFKLARDCMRLKRCFLYLGSAGAVTIRAGCTFQVWRSWIDYVCTGESTLMDLWGSTKPGSSSSLMTIGFELWAVSCDMTRPLLVSSGRNKPRRTSHNNCSKAEMLAAAPSLEYVRPMRKGCVWYPSCNLRLISSPRLAAYDNVVVFKEWLATLRPSTGNASPNNIKRNQPAASWLSKGLAPGWPSGWGAGITPSLPKSKDREFLTSSHSSIQLFSTRPFAVATIGKNWWRCCCDCIVLWEPTRASR